MLDKLKRKLLNRLTNMLREHDNVYLSKNATVGKNVRLAGAMIFGDVNLGDNCKVANGASLTGTSKITIGRFTSITGPNTDIVANIQPVTVGAFTSIARNVTIQESNHRTDQPTSFNIFYNLIDKGDFSLDATSKGPIEIGNDVWIGTHCVILSGVKIGDGAVVAANAVVASDVPAYAVVGGTPAKVISYRFEPDVIDALKELRWWTWPEEKIKSNRDFFGNTVTLESIRKVK